MHNGKKPPLGEEKSVTDTAAAISFLNVLFEHCVGPPNLCVLLNSDLGREAGKMITTRSETKLKNFIRQHDQPRWGSYFCVATMRSEEHHHSKDGISETPALHADIDFKDLAIDTRDDVIRKLKALRKPPSILVDSGNGIHAYWRFKKRDQRQSDVQPPVFYVRQPIIYAANRENGIARVEAALKLLCDLVGGDTKVTHPAAVMRLPGTHNSKFSEWKQVAVIEQNNNEYDLEELEEWLAETSPIILRKVRPQAKTAGQNNFSNYGDSHSYKPPIDVEERLANMMYMGEGDSAIHTTQVSVSASLLSAGVHPKEVVKILMAATEAAAGDYWKRWNKRHEERNIEKMCETWLEKLGKEEKRKKEKREEPDEGTSTPPDPIEMFWHGELDERPPVSWLVDRKVLVLLLDNGAAQKLLSCSILAAALHQAYRLPVAMSSGRVASYSLRLKVAMRCAPDLKA